jgi:hypothetical protein
MPRARHPSPRRRPRCLILCIAACLFIGCVLVPVDESRFGSARNLRFLPNHVPYAARDIIFSHSIHAFVECDACHFGTAGGPAPDEGFEAWPGEDGDFLAGGGGAEPGADAEPHHGDVSLPSMALCFGCHDGKGAPNQCLTCHITNRKETKPGFHDALFPRHHGDMADREAYKCGLCHVEQDCKTCHQERKPLSHTERFLRSTHGRMATHDRRSCAVCHETAYCENCHMQPPPDHTPVFRLGGHRQPAMVRGRSCLVCHRFEDVCARCHN